MDLTFNRFYQSQHERHQTDSRANFRVKSKIDGRSREVEENDGGLQASFIADLSTTTRRDRIISSIINVETVNESREQSYLEFIEQM